MLYAIPKHDSSSLEMVKLVLQMIEAQSQQVPDSLKSMVYDVIDQGKITNILSHKSEIDRPIWV